MLYIILNDEHNVVQVTEETPSREEREVINRAGGRIVHRGDMMPSIGSATDYAAAASRFMGELYLPVDAGPRVMPRYDVIRAPKVGDAVSMGFNGDYCPCGKIASISPSMHRIKTDDGTVFHRHAPSRSVPKSLSARWLSGGTFAMVQGHHDKRNPSF